jgi:ATP phosphoribosyltransferase
MGSKLIFAVPSKGRLMEATTGVLAEGGLEVRKTGSERGYRGEIVDVGDVEIAFISASEIANALRIGQVHLGVTGEDLVREEIADAENRVKFLKPLGFGHADVVVAVPACWIDVRAMEDLDEVAIAFRREHQRRMRVATKYVNLTRRHFSYYGISDYRIVESLGATEGTPAAGTAELIVDITSTGTTIRANGLKQIEGGTILKSEANLIESRMADWTPELRAVQNDILKRLGI